MTDEEATAAAYTQAKLMGCMCKPDIELERDPEEPLFIHANVYHDGWCPLYMSRKRSAN